MKSVTDNHFIINRKKILYDQRYSMSRLAVEIGVTPQGVSQSVNGTTQSLKMHRAICKKLGLSLAEFWPEIYGDQHSESVENIVSHDVDVLSSRC